MKNSVVLLFLICCNVAFSQVGKLYLKDSKLIIGKVNTYVYEPPAGVEIPNEAKVRVVYNNNFDFTGGGASLVKKANGYEFSLQVPDSTRYFIAAIVDGKKVVDNNKNTGYDMFLKSSNPTEVGKSIVERIMLITYAKNTLTTKLNLKLDSSSEGVLAAYNKLYAKYPMMKNDKSYTNYLYLKEPTDKEKTKAEMLAFAKKCEKKNSEDYLIIAYNLYSNLKMPDESKKLEKQITVKYPSGSFESSKFFFDFANHPDKTEAYILERLNLYKATFKKFPTTYKDYFYKSLLKIYVDNKDFQKIDECEKLLSNKKEAASLYNSIAWKLSGEDFVRPGKDLDLAEKLSKRSLDIVADLQKQSDFPDDLIGFYYMYGDTYSLILYKLNRFEEAFKLQDDIGKQGGLNTEGKVLNAVLMEKVKGPEITKMYIEDELSKGTNSVAMITQLEAIYRKLNLPMDNFKVIKAKSIEMANAAAKDKMVKKYGSIEAINFSLKNLEGKMVSLSDLKGKVVVLDFWATWCGPCKASFPGMQELVTKYKDKNVEFLFMNTWEKGKQNEITENVTKFINDKKYSFNVVFDYDSAVTAKYKIEGIPTKILIDKNGNLVSFGGSEKDLMRMIDEQLSL